MLKIQSLLLRLKSFLHSSFRHYAILSKNELEICLLARDEGGLDFTLFH